MAMAACNPMAWAGVRRALFTLPEKGEENTVAGHGIVDTRPGQNHGAERGKHPEGDGAVKPAADPGTEQAGHRPRQPLPSRHASVLAAVHRYRRR